VHFAAHKAVDSSARGPQADASAHRPGQADLGSRLSGEVAVDPRYSNRADGSHLPDHAYSGSSYTGKTDSSSCGVRNVAGSTAQARRASARCRGVPAASGSV
jgi:hypothetical protein